jgi:DNA-binding transcriptional ArsR family regulator
MVNHYGRPPDAMLDLVFGALADPTRRAVLSRLRRGERSVGELAAPFGMSLPGFIKHLAILEDAGLIARHKTGRVVTCQLDAGASASALAWLRHHEQFWNTQLDRLGAFVEQKESPTWIPPPKKRPRSGSAATIARASPPSTRRGRTRSK